MYFLESSAFVKLFVFEEGTNTMIRLVETSADTERSASALALVEVRSALRRRERLGDVSSVAAETAVDMLTAEWRRLIEQPLTSAVIGISLEMLDKHALRSLDALQLASALVARTQLRNDSPFTFVCSDTRLCEAARAEDMLVLNPSGP